MIHHIEIRGIKPRPAGSKSAFPAWKGKAGKKHIGVFLMDSSKYAKTWKSKVRKSAEQQIKTEPLEGSVFLMFIFRFRRPKNHYNAKGLKINAPLYPIVKPDLTKLTRGTEDALKGIAWKDDSQVIGCLHFKTYIASNQKEGADIFYFSALSMENNFSTIFRLYNDIAKC